MNIGDVWLALRADGARFQAEAIKEAQKAGDAAGATLGSRMGKAASVALRGGLAVLSAGAAIATRGLLELEQITADFTAETGASADEAKRAGQAINEMSGRNLQPMKEIGAVLTKVHTDLGLTGEAAEETAERFLQFARVTKRDAATEVAAFDDILDAWGLTADDSVGLMDQLIKSHQDYGGTIADDEAALKNLAPAMKALNFDVDDTIGLLNLFKTKGLDAAATQRAFNTAVSKLPPGTNLQDILEKIQAIEDPAERAAAAVEIFGSRGGVALANALGPGIGAIEDYVITTDEAKGATLEARDALDSTFSSRVQLAIRGVTSKIIELGSSFGPALTGIASLASLGGALGFGKLGSKISSGLAGAWKTVLTSTLVSGAIARVGSLAATLYLRALMLGDAISGAVSKAWGKVASSALVSNAVSKVGGLAATAYLKALIVGDAISKAVSGAWTSVAGTGSKATKAAGAAGRAAGLAFTLGLVLFVAKIAEEIEPHITKAGQDIHKMLFPGGTPFDDLHPEEWPWPLGPKDAPEWAGGTGKTPIAEFPGKMADDLIAGFPKVTAAATGLGASVADPLIQAFRNLGYSLDQAKELVGSGAHVIAGEVVGAFELMAPTIADGAEVWEKYRTDVAAEQEKAITDQLDFTSKALSDLVGFQSSVEDALSGVYNAENDATVTRNRIVILEGQLTDLRKERVKKGKDISKEEIADYENNRIAIEGELQQLKLHAALIGDDMHRVTALTALLTAKDLKAGLLSENDNIRTASQVQRDKIIGYLKDIETQGGPAAKQATAVLAQWMDPTNPLSPLYGVAAEVGKTGTDYVGNLTSGVAGGTPNFAGKIRNLERLLDPKTGPLSNAGTDGFNTGAAFIGGASAGIQSGLVKFAGKLEQMERLLKAGSPPLPGAALYGIDKWAVSTGESFVNPFAAVIGRLPEAIRRLLDKVRDNLSRPMGMPALGEMADPEPIFRKIAEAASRTLASISAPTTPAIAVAGAGVRASSAAPFLGDFRAGPATHVEGDKNITVNVALPPSVKYDTPSDVVRSLRHLNVYGTFGEERK